jgi:hypothetical protein
LVVCDNTVRKVGDHHGGPMRTFTLGRGDRPERRDHDQAHDEGCGERTRHRFDPP